MKIQFIYLPVFTLLFSVASISHSVGQPQLTRNSRIVFFSKNELENIEAANNQVTSVFNPQNGDILFMTLIKGFKFRKALMEDHFNENYMESNKFPKANFKGAITDISKINLIKNGSYPVRVKGELTIHGITKSIETPATITISGGKINAVSKFNIAVKDYGIKIPKLLVKNIAEIIEVIVDCTYEPLKKT